MCTIDRSKGIANDITPSESEASYQQAQELLQDRNDGYVPYDRLFTSLAQVRATFPSITEGSLLNYMGNEFYWKRDAGEALVLYGKNDWAEGLKERGLIEICRFRVPEAWIGVGCFSIAWPNMGKDEDNGLLLCGLYLYSTNVNDFELLVANENATTAFMAMLFLDRDNADLFNKLAEERFDSLR
jgi:hypothetical protein